VKSKVFVVVEGNLVKVQKFEERNAQLNQLVK